MHTRMRQRHHYLTYNIIYIPLIERCQLTVSYYSYLILSYRYSNFVFFSCTFLYANYFCSASEKSIALIKRPTMKRMIQSRFVVRQFYNSLVTIRAHKETRNSFRSHDKRVSPVLKLLKQHMTIQS